MKKYYRRLTTVLRVPSWHKGMSITRYIAEFDGMNGLKSVKYHGH